MPWLAILGMRPDQDAGRAHPRVRCRANGTDPLLDEDDFEDSLDVLIDTYPDREAIVERCEDL